MSRVWASPTCHSYGKLGTLGSAPNQRLRAQAPGAWGQTSPGHSLAPITSRDTQTHCGKGLGCRVAQKAPCIAGAWAYLAPVMGSRASLEAL